MENRIYVTNKGGHDFEAAKKLGVITPLTVGNINPIQVDRVLVGMMQELKDSTKNDYLLLSGHQVAVAVAVAILISMHHRVNLLIYNKYTKDYNIRQITAKQIEDVLDSLEK